MRCVCWGGLLALLLLAGPALAQQPATTAASGNFSSFLSQSMTRPAISMGQRPTMPLAPSLSSYFPSFPNFQNILTMRNFTGGGGSQVAFVQIPRPTPAPMPKKKKKMD